MGTDLEHGEQAAQRKQAELDQLSQQVRIADARLQSLLAFVPFALRCVGMHQFAEFQLMCNPELRR